MMASDTDGGGDQQEDWLRLRLWATARHRWQSGACLTSGLLLASAEDQVQSLGESGSSFNSTQSREMPAKRKGRRRTTTRLIEGRTESEEELDGSDKKKKRRRKKRRTKKCRRIKLERKLSKRPFSKAMRPSWRQLALATLISFILTSLFAHLQLGTSASNSNCQLLNQCLALQVNRTFGSKPLPAAVSSVSGAQLNSAIAAKLTKPEVAPGGGSQLAATSNSLVSRQQAAARHSGGGNSTARFSSLLEQKASNSKLNAGQQQASGEAATIPSNKDSDNNNVIGRPAKADQVPSQSASSALKLIASPSLVAAVSAPNPNYSNANFSNSNPNFNSTPPASTTTTAATPAAQFAHSDSLRAPESRAPPLPAQGGPARTSESWTAAAGSGAPVATNEEPRSEQAPRRQQQQREPGRLFESALLSAPPMQSFQEAPAMAAARRQLSSLSLQQGLLQSVLREALNELVAAQQSDETIFGSASGERPLVLREESMLGDALPAGLGHHQGQKQHLQPQLVSTASASAPSISLPPLPHLLVPRNPFRLFASSSAPVASRHRPTGRGWFSSAASRPSATISSQQQHQQQQQQRQLAFPETISGSSLRGFGSPAAEHLFEPLGATTSTRLYAHSHSAEQLEQLVRAASQQSGLGLQPAPILPAIVSSPGGTFPGFYIPAIEPQTAGGGSGGSESESQLSELRAGQRAPSYAPNQQHQLASTTIPGTDYILHPEEVRAMMSIGESAWRKQLEQEQRQGGNQPQQNQQNQQNQYQTASSNRHESDWQPTVNSANLMRENHAQNARDFAFVDPRTRRENQNQNQGQQQHQRQQAQNQSASGNLESQLVKQLSSGQNQVRTFPAIIRLNDQDYVHWPLVRLQRQPHQAMPEATTTSQLYAPYRAPALIAFQAGSRPAPPASLMAAASSGSQQQQRPELSRLRLATQLTQNEIRQVEDSIIEALIMAQTLQHQRRLAAAESQHQVQLAAKQTQQQQQQKRFLGGLFTRRRRRNSDLSKQQSGRQQVKVAPSAPMIIASAPIGLIPLPNLSSLQLAAASASYPLLHTYSDATSDTPQLMPPQPAEEALASEQSGVSRRLPLVLADQETNKPQRQLPSGGASASASAAATEPLATAQSAPQQANLVEPLAFGSRLRGDSGLRTASGASGGAGQALRAQASRFQPHQLLHNPHWPAAMEGSDADYFPPANSAARLRQGSPEKGEVANQPISSYQAAQSREQPAGSSSRLQPQQQQSFVTSQLKLQFAQDYRAREGVPIYNNNVRVAGALDRQRLHSSASSSPTQGGQSEPPHKGDAHLSGDDGNGNEEEEEDNEAVEGEDLQQRGSTSIGSSSSHGDKKERAKKQDEG